MAKLKAAGVDPASLKTFDDFDAALAKLRSSLPASEPVIALGNKDQYGAIHMWGMVQGAYDAGAVDPRLDLPQGRRDVRHAGQPRSR